MRGIAMKRLILAGALFAACTTTAISEEMKEGWGLQFRQDTFDKSVLPLAMMSESGDGFDKALIAFACASSGDLVSFFQPERFMMFVQTAKATFRHGDQTLDFTFTAGEVPHFGKRLIASPEDSVSIVEIFEAASGADVPFRTEKKQGVFTSVGSKQTFEIMRSLCGE